MSVFVYNDSQAAVLAESMEIYAGWNHTFIRMPDGRWQAWGLNTSGQLGNGATTNVLKPIRVTVPTHFIMRKQEILLVELQENGYTKMDI